MDDVVIRLDYILAVEFNIEAWIMENRLKDPGLFNGLRGDAKREFQEAKSKIPDYKEFKNSLLYLEDDSARRSALMDMTDGIAFLPDVQISHGVSEIMLATLESI